jgi:hypothetical protein
MLALGLDIVLELFEKPFLHFALSQQSINFCDIFDVFLMHETSQPAFGVL